MDQSDDKGDEPGSAHLPVGSATKPDLGFIGSTLSLSPVFAEANAPRARGTTADPGETAAATPRHTEPELDPLLQSDTTALIAPGQLETASSVPSHPAPAVAHLPAYLADQVAPAIVAAARKSETGQRVTVSVTPGELGRVDISVQRNVDGTVHIQVSAEHVSTLDLLRRDQTELARTLDQADINSGTHSLSFSLDSGTPGGGGGGGNGMHGWYAGGSRQENSAPVSQLAYVETTRPATPIGRRPDRRGSIDVTA